MNSSFKQAYSEIRRGIQLAKCRKCGCMRGTLENLKASLMSLKNKVGTTRFREAADLHRNVTKWIKELETLEYPCLGCKYCIPAEAMTILTSKFPSLASSTLSSCEFQISKDSWPPVAGEYTVLDKSAPVAVSTLASANLEEKLARLKPEGLCIAGKTETENIGIDKIVKNIISNPALNFLIVAGKDPDGHKSGETILGLWKNGVDKNMRVIGSTGRRPILRNVTLSEIKSFREQVHVEDLIGCEDSKTLASRIKELAKKATSYVSAATCSATESCICEDQPISVNIQPIRHEPLIVKTIPIKTSLTRKVESSACGCGDICGDDGNMTESGILLKAPKIKAEKPKSVKLDKAGYFVIIPMKKNKTIMVEHYSYDNRLLRTIEGKNGRDIYHTIISNKWITDLSHAAYIGKELARAELSIKKGFKFVQDGA